MTILNITKVAGEVLLGVDTHVDRPGGGVLHVAKAMVLSQPRVVIATRGPWTLLSHLVGLSIATGAESPDDLADALPHAATAALTLLQRIANASRKPAELDEAEIALAGWSARHDAPLVAVWLTLDCGATWVPQPLEPAAGNLGQRMGSWDPELQGPQPAIVDAASMLAASRQQVADVRRHRPDARLVGGELALARVARDCIRVETLGPLE